MVTALYTVLQFSPVVRNQGGGPPLQAQRKTPDNVIYSFFWTWD